MEPETERMQKICILNGIHRGALIEVAQQSVRIGGDDDCGCLLSDQSARGMAIEVSRDDEGALTVEGVRGDVLRNGRRLRVGKVVSLKKGVIVSLGDVQIAPGDTLATARENMTLRNRQRWMMNAGAVMAAFVGVFVLISSFGGIADAYNSPGQYRAATLVNPVVRHNDPLGDLTRVVERSGLSSVIELSRFDASQIVATGSVTLEENQKWTEIVQWFDGRFGGRTVLVSNLEERSEAYTLPFQVKSVHSAPNPRVILRDGRAFPVGAVLPGGWELSRIAGTKIEITRGTEALIISF